MATATISTATSQKVHINVHQFARNARVTDMTNAGKRGKVCRSLFISGCGGSAWNDASMVAAGATNAIFAELENWQNADYDTIRTVVLAIVERALSAGASSQHLAVHDEEIQGIKAPRPELTAGVAGKWSAKADIESITLRELDDPNEWTEITFKQTGPVAYRIAQSVWSRIQAATTRHEASQILHAAGAKLHGYCAMD